MKHPAHKSYCELVGAGYQTTLTSGEREQRTLAAAGKVHDL